MGSKAPTYQRDPYLVQLEDKQRREAEARAREARNLYRTEEAAFAAGLRGRRSLPSGFERGYALPAGPTPGAGLL